MAIRMVRQRIGIGVLLVLPAIFLSGCIYAIIGGVAAAGGYAISQDTIKGEIDAEFNSVWDNANEVLSIMGTIESESYEMGEIIAAVSGAKVWVHVIQLTPSTIRLRVKARKNLFPSIGTAQNVFIKIMNRVGGEP